MALRRRAADDISRAVVPVVSAARDDTAQAQPRRAHFPRPQAAALAGPYVPAPWIHHPTPPLGLGVWVEGLNDAC
jgi:hypothetical protein